MAILHSAAARLVVFWALLGLVISTAPGNAAPPEKPTEKTAANSTEKTTAKSTGKSTDKPASSTTVDQAESDRDAHNLVLLAPDHPVFVQVRVQVDAKGLKSVRTAYAAQIVKNYDRDEDGMLDRDESKNVPPLVKSPTTRDTVSIAERWEAVDIDPADDKVSVDELAAYIDRIFGNTFELSVKPQRATQGVDLFSLLDLNHDGRLSREELLVAAKSLRKLDFDEDETFTIDELQGFRNPQFPQNPMVPSAQTVDQPFLLLDDEQSIGQSAEQLLQRYGTSSAKGEKPVLKRGAMNISQTAFAAVDADSNGELNQAELATFLKAPALHLVLDAQLMQKMPGQPKLLVVEDPLHAVQPPAKGAPKTADRLALATGGLGLQMQSVPSKSSVSDTRKFYKLEFTKADKDKNGYLDETEFAQLRLQNADFKSVDRNGDAMVLLDELMAYIDQDSASSQSRVEMSVSHDGKSVFEVIDANHDRRLSHRELVHAFERLREFDRNGDEAIAAVELAGRFKVELGLGKPELFRKPTPGARGDTTAPMITTPTAGPSWFRKMDRNRDGDVSRHEFLGPPALFLKLDADADGLLTPEEAQQASPEATSGAAP